MILFACFMLISASNYGQSSDSTNHQITVRKADKKDKAKEIKRKPLLGPGQALGISIYYSRSIYVGGFYSRLYPFTSQPTWYGALSIEAQVAPFISAARVSAQCEVINYKLPAGVFTGIAFTQNRETGMLTSPLGMRVYISRFTLGGGVNLILAGKHKDMLSRYFLSGRFTF